MKRILKSAPSHIKEYVCNNVLFLTFVLSSLINSFLLRAFTVKFSYNQIKPLLADIAMVLFIGLFAYCFKPKRRFVYYMIWTCVFALLSAGNSIYYTNYKSFISVSLISTASQLGGVIDAVTENIMEPKDLIFLWSIIAMIAEYVFIRKKSRIILLSFRRKSSAKIRSGNPCGFGKRSRNFCHDSYRHRCFPSCKAMEQRICARNLRTLYISDKRYGFMYPCKAEYDAGL